MIEKSTEKPRVRMNPVVWPRVQEWMRRNKIRKTNVAYDALVEHALDYFGIPEVQPDSQETPNG